MIKKLADLTLLELLIILEAPDSGAVQGVFFLPLSTYLAFYDRIGYDD